MGEGIARLFQDILGSEGLVGTVLTLEDNGSRLEGAYAVPLSSRDVDGDIRAVRRKFNSLSADTLEIIIELLHQAPAQADNRLRAIAMAVYRHRTARFDGVEHTLGLVLRAVAKVKVHPQARRCFRLGREFVQK